MNKIILAVLLLASTFAWAGSIHNPADYTINVHVSRSRLDGTNQKLNVVIDGKKYELRAYGVNKLLSLGDYKAKIARDERKNGYDSVQSYEFLFPDQKVRKFVVVGQTE